VEAEGLAEDRQVFFGVGILEIHPQQALRNLQQGAELARLHIGAELAGGGIV
jgi:hypothetical protein